VDDGKINDLSFHGVSDLGLKCVKWVDKKGV